KRSRCGGARFSIESCTSQRPRAIISHPTLRSRAEHGVIRLGDRRLAPQPCLPGGPQCILGREKRALGQAAVKESPSLARQANEIVRDLTRPTPWIYWCDLAATTLAIYLSLYLAVTLKTPTLSLLAAAAAVLALYRGI